MEFDEFLSAHLTALTRYAGVLTGDRQQAHDVLTDALVAVAQSWSRIGAMQFPLAYVRSAVTTTYHCRRDRRRRTFPTGSDALLDLPVDAQTGQVDDRDEVDVLLRRLPDRQRAALVLRYYLDLPDREIADALGCSIATVRSMVFRGLAGMRAAVGSSVRE